MFVVLKTYLKKINNNNKINGEINCKNMMEFKKNTKSKGDAKLYKCQVQMRFMLDADKI